MLDWYPEIAALADRGWQQIWIAESIVKDVSYVRKILRAGREKQVELNELPIEVAVSDDLMEQSPEAFERFYLRFSPFDVLPDHAKEWVRLALANPRMIINTPPGHAKSAILSVWFAAWLICINRDRRIIIVSKTRDLASTWGWSIAAILTSEEIVRAYGRFVSEKMGDTAWRPGAGQLMVMSWKKQAKPGDFSIICRGMDQQILGLRGDFVICDDIVDAETYESPDKLRKAQGKWVQIASRVNPGAHILVVMQRVHPEDLTNELLLHPALESGEAAWKVHTQPMVLDWEEKKLLWPEWFTWSDVERIRGDIGSVMFSTMYQQDPLPPEATLVRAEWIEQCKDHDRGLGVGVDRKTAQFPATRVIAIDPSPTEWNALLVADVLQTKGGLAIMLIDCWRWKGKTPEFEANVERACKRYKPDAVIIEDSTFFGWIIDSLLRDVLSNKIKFIRHHTGNNKGAIDVGADSMAVDYEMGRISIPWGDDEAKAAFKPLISEALGWPKAKVDDTFLALWFIKWNRKKLKPQQAWITQPQRRQDLNASGRAKYDELMRQGALPYYRR
jgi:hypothetical protein